MIDLNCDLGEGAGHDAELLELCTSANVCCGGHAGDAATSRATLEEAARRGVHVGAHPGYPDRANFGRKELDLPEPELVAEIARQVVWLQELTKPLGVPLRHLKPHGALYNQACRDPAIARAVVHVAERFGLAVFGLPESELERAAAGRVAFIREGFADRGYRADGTLVPRNAAGAFIHDPRVAADQADWLIAHRGVQTVCVHGDTPDAIAFLRGFRSNLLARGYLLGPAL
jgi:UPF0271 protein